MKITGIKKMFYIFFFLNIFYFGSTTILAAKPILFFSDLEWGPKTGWENSSTKGAAISVWGKNFGTSRSSNYITVNGTQLVNDSDYSEWGSTGPARGLERITFWLNSNCQDGTGEITVTVHGIKSNALNFTVMAGNIYFISVTDGNDSYNGQYSTRTGHSGSDGPFRNLSKFNPSKNPSHDTSYICYVRAGTYTELDVDSAFVALRGPYGGINNRKALIGYPSETPTINCANAGRGVIWVAKYSPYGRCDYFTYSKLKVDQGEDAFKMWGNYCRVISCYMKDMRDDAWSGVVMVDNSQYSKVYGNLFENCGNNSYKHNIYVKSHKHYISGDKTCQYNYIGWNEFDSPYASDLHGGTIFSSSAGDAPAYTNHLYIHDNYFHGGNMDYIYIGDNHGVEYVYVWNNIFGPSNSGMAGVIVYNGSRDFWLYNNTFYKSSASSEPLVYIWGNSLINVRSKNNIFFGRTNQQVFYFDGSGSTLSSDHDLFWDQDGSVNRGAGVHTNYIQNQDPRLTNPESGDFSIELNSPARDSGTSTVVNDISELTSDYVGVFRPQIDRYDIGAFECNPKLSPPANLSIIQP